VIDLTNESGRAADEAGLVALAGFAQRQLHIHPEAAASILLVDEATMATYHERFMDEPGPTDVLSFPMDEFRPPGPGEEPPQGLLGDVVLCPAVTARQAAEFGRTPDQEAEYLLVHGLLHLLGFDHAEPAEKRVMFNLNDALIAAWDKERGRRAGRRLRRPAR
jgi:probable rRNA maturation factor